ncbi:hypothetical protein NQ176_g9710 [Zarea fungicola]|uniref:Uncharacterized protein n=1 Tax=Zarea fungicola TaxID=93591 RepID=A0ACC1MKG3_9HYPO|nr:hypothetical protein NQ176_g9710 [Lecanicillium fungicola]
MLRIHAWQGFSIAESSRTRARGIETGTKLSNGPSLPRITALRSHSLFSTSASLNDGPKPAFPGGFGGAGKFGAFASKAKPTATSGLLPHEVAARSKTVTGTPTPASLSRPKPSRPIDPTRNEKAIKSKSILADIFHSERQPRDPATPASWSSSSDRQANRGDANRKPGDSNIWQEITKNRRSPVKHVRAAAQKGKTANTSSITELSEFWNEMEDQASASRTQRDRDTREREVPKKMQGKYAGVHNHPSHVGDEPPRNRPEASADKPRKSRFDEEVKSRDIKKSKRVKRQGAYNTADDEWEDDGDRWNELQERKKAKEARKRARSKEPDVIPIFLPEFISASNLAQALKQRVDSFMKDMENLGFENITGDTIMTGETAALVAMEYGFEPTVDNGSQRDIQPAPVSDDVSSLPSRPPVVTIMGHVDHGKTTLLDYLRKSSVAAQEHGGITQHIGAFIVSLSSGKQITFLDTPGHAAFLSMRQRGANVTDIVVLVVAADDSVKPQTLEALKHARAAKVPIIVAINKIDKEDARVDQVKADLSRHGVEIEDYGGDVQVVCVSGKTGQGMPELEENIVTLSEILDVRAETDGMANGWLLESSVKQDGRAATVLVKRGTLRMGDHIVAGKTWARIRSR